MHKLVKRLLCRHFMGWSERRQGEVCYKCGRFRSAMTTSALAFPEPDPGRTLDIRFPAPGLPGDPGAAPRFISPRTARD